MKKLFKILTGVLLLIGFVVLNLKHNSVYYAKNMPKGEGQKPELVMMIDNLDWIYTPDIEGIIYRSDGTRKIKNLNGSQRFGNIYFDEMEYIYANGNSLTYIFNRKFELIDAMDVKKMESFDVETVNKDEIVAQIEAFVEPVMEVQTKPLINLQWLFNLIYQDEFK